jgi:hypothetical protein
MKQLASYALRRHSPSFEFFNWLVMIKAEGAEKIIFDTARPKTLKFSEESVMRRFYSIVEPGPALAGLPWRHGDEIGKLDATASQLLPWWQSGRRFERLRSPLTPIKCDFTITIRDNLDGAFERNSNREAWIRFADEIGAVLIEDWFVKPIDLHERMALYAGAKMNFGVCNGPIHLLSLTEYPVTMVVNNKKARISQTKWGMQANTKYPWMLDNQFMIWIEDTPENLRRMFHEVML